MFNRILVPLDATPEAEAALEPARELAKVFDAEVTLILVADSREVTLASIAEAFGASGSVAATIQHENTLEAVGDAYLESVIEQSGHSGWRKIVAEGDPADVIADHAEERGVNLIVMASHGRSGLTRILRGSVAEHVARRSKIPVLIVDVTEEED